MRPRIVPDWPAEVFEYIKTHYDQLSWSEIARNLYLPVAKVKYEAKLLGLKKTPESILSLRIGAPQKRSDIWTPAEIQYLREHWATMSKTQIGKQLARSPGAVSGQVTKLGLKKTAEQTKQIRLANCGKISTWTAEEDRFLIENYEKMSSADIAHHLGRFDKTTIRNRYNALGYSLSSEARKLIHKKRQEKRPDIFWTSEQEEFLIKNYATVPIRQLATILNKSRCSIAGKAKLFDLSLSPEQFAAKRLDPNYLPDTNIVRFITKDPDLAQLVMQQPTLIRLKRLQIALKKRTKYP